MRKCERVALEHVYLRDNYFTRDDVESLTQAPQAPWLPPQTGLYPSYRSRLTLISGARKKWT